jgi:hypothetical protein
VTESYRTPHAETHTEQGHGHNGHGHSHVLPRHHQMLEPRPSSAQAVADFAARPFGAGIPNALILVLGLLAVVGVVAIVLNASGGREPHSKWGYTVAVLAFLMSTAASAPLLAFATRLAKGFWAVPARRAAELYFTSAFVTIPLFLFILLTQLPSFEGRLSIWNDWPGSPYVYEATLAIVFGLLGLIILYFTTRPDMAVVRDVRGRAPFTGWADGWWGRPRQWNVLTTGLILLGAFYLALYAYMHIFLAATMAMSLVSGWKSAIYPGYLGVSGIQAGLATTILTMAALRKWGGMRGYLQITQFWGAAKLLLATSLLFFYFTWDEFITYWYGRQPFELALIHLLFFGPYIVLFLTSFACNFVLPFLLLIWNPIRVGIKGPTRVAAIVLFGNLVDRLRIFVASWSVAGPVGEPIDLAHVPPFQFPTILDLLIVVGMISGVLCLYLLALKRFPPVSLWEYKQANLLTVEKQFHRIRVAVLAKPN